ncbi:hypothetical protein ACFL6K_06785 [Candidatus Latescibacterota bacterium]
MIFKKGFHSGYLTGSLCLVLVIFSAFLSSCDAQDVELDPQFQEIMTYNFGDSKESMNNIADLINATKDFPSARLNIEKQFVTILASDATLECKDFICRQLWVMGTDYSVPQLAKMLVVAETSDMARYALETNPSELVCSALSDAMKTAKGNALIGIINTVGNRNNPESIDALKKLAAGSDSDISSAATAALNKISN